MAYWSVWSEWEYSKADLKCTRYRSCYKMQDDVVDSVCIDNNGLSARFEVLTAPYCDEAIDVEIKKIVKGIDICDSMCIVC